MKVPMLDLHAQYEALMPAIRARLDEVFATHHYIMGAHVQELEEKMQDYLGIKHAIGCASGTDALVLAVKALDLGVGDEIITTPFTFFATASSIWRNNARPVFADIDPNTFNLDADSVEKAITSRTRAIMPVHLFGQCSNMDTIMEIANKHKLKVIEDNAQGVGSTWNGQMSCSFGDIGTLSFFPSKNLGAMGDGGMCLTNDDELATALRQLRVHGEGPKYYHRCVGLNSRLDTLQAAVLIVKLDYLESWSKQRRENAAFYNEQLANVGDIKTPYIDPKAKSIYNQYTLITSQRDELLAHLRKKDIGCAVYYPLPLHLQKCFADLGYKAGDLPVAEELANKVLSIPIYPELTREMQEYVTDSIKEYFS